MYGYKKGKKPKNHIRDRGRDAFEQQVFTEFKQLPQRDAFGRTQKLQSEAIPPPLLSQEVSRIAHYQHFFSPEEETLSVSKVTASHLSRIMMLPPQIIGKTDSDAI